MTKPADLGLPDDEERLLSQIDTRMLEVESRLLDSNDLDKLPEPQELVATLLDRDVIAWLHGEPGTGKSFIALDLACHIALGRQWRDLHVHQGPVLYVAAEGWQGLERRRRAWEVGNLTHVGRDLLTFLPMPIQLLNVIDLEVLIRIVGRLKPALLVLDTQARVTLGAEENSSTDMGRLVEAADRVRQVCGTTVLLVHHETRGSGHMRGSTAMAGAAGTTLSVKKQDGAVVLTSGKQKERDDPEPFWGRLVPAADSVYWSQTTVGLSLEASRAERVIYAAMWDMHGTTGASSATLLKSTDLPHGSFYRGLNSLVGKGILFNDGTKRSTLWVLSDPKERLPFDL